MTPDFPDHTLMQNTLVLRNELHFAQVQGLLTPTDIDYLQMGSFKASAQ